MNSITGVVVNYCTPDHLRKAILSIRKFYPLIEIIVIDGSPSVDYEFPFTIVKHIKKNIGHGPGMNLGIFMANTPYVLLFDTDIEMIAPPLHGMVPELEAGNVYGCGMINEVNKYGFNVSSNGIKYLHPHFALISRDKFYQYAPCIHHGAPFLKAMVEVGNAKRDALASFPVDQYVKHEGGATRKLDPKEFKRQNWER